jgi:hypothetical protein
LFGKQKNEKKKQDTLLLSLRGRKRSKKIGEGKHLSFTWLSGKKLINKKHTSSIKK